MSGPEISFGPFRFNPVQHVLWHGETPVQIGSRALAILGALMETPGRLVSRSELLERAWPGLKVDDSNLKVQIYGLRKALAGCSTMIRAEASLGYRFVGEVIRGSSASEPAALRRFSAPRTIAAPLGRDGVLKSIAELLAKSRLVTLLGPGGIGKTTVALALAGQLDDDDTHADGICFVDIGRITDESKVYAAITASLELPVDVAPTIDQILLALHGRRLLLILDSCEHVTDTVAQIAERVLSETHHIRMLVTSREALRVGNEVLWRLEPLDTPPSGLASTVRAIADYASVQLFERTVRQGAVNYRLSDEMADAISEVCRRLDGIPLAIEIAASMVVVLGVDEVRRGLDERFSLLNMDRRTAVPRQRSLAATIDWSYNLLSVHEQAVLRRLACFTGWFTLDAAIAVAGDDQLELPTVRNVVVQLANKSLLSLNPQTTPPEYRLLDMTRAYAAAAVNPKGEAEQAKERHARYFVNALEQKNWDTYSPVAERFKLRGYLDEVRAALDWAYRVVPDLALRLTIAAEMLWLELTSVAQGVHYLRLALSYLDADPDPNPLVRARVLVALASAGANIVAPGHDELTLYEQAWEAAKLAQDDFLQLKALQTLMTFLLRRRRPFSHYLDAFSIIAAKSSDHAVRHLPLVYSAYRDVEISDIESSARALESFVGNCSFVPKKYHFGAELLLQCQVTLALIKHWMGYGHQAKSLFAALVDEAERRANPPTLCYVLIHGAIRVELDFGRFDRARTYLQKLDEISNLYKPWQAFAAAYRALLLRDDDRDVSGAEALLSLTIRDEPILRSQGGLFSRLMFELAETRLALGDLEGAETVLKEVMGYAANVHDARIVGVHDRILAKILMKRSQPGDQESARKLLNHAIEITKLRKILSFEFEAALLLAELELARARPDEARQLMTQLLSRVEDPSGVPGFAKAHAILDRVSSLN